MGWTASADWALEFKDADAIRALAAEYFQEEPEKLDQDPEDLIVTLLEDFHESSDFFWQGEGEFVLIGWGGGKAYIEVHRYELIAKYADGKADWFSDEEGWVHWRVRFKNGVYTEYAGVVTYPEDFNE